MSTYAWKYWSYRAIYSKIQNNTDTAEALINSFGSDGIFL